MAMSSAADAIQAIPVEQALRPGSQVLLEWFDAHSIYHSARTLLEGVDEQGMALEAPIEGRAFAHIETGTELTLVWQRRPDVLTAAVHVTARKPQDPPLLLTTRPKCAERTTLRRFYRVDVDLPVTFPDGKGRMVNLSGSGCVLAWEQRAAPDPGREVPFKVKLPSAPATLVLSGRVMRVFPARDRAALDFVRLTRKQQDDLIRYVCRRQTELLNAGVLRPDLP